MLLSSIPAAETSLADQPPVFGTFVDLSHGSAEPELEQGLFSASSRIGKERREREEEEDLYSG
jgi:hypothetical protein